MQAEKTTLGIICGLLIFGGTISLGICALLQQGSSHLLNGMWARL